MEARQTSRHHRQPSPETQEHDHSHKHPPKDNSYGVAVGALICALLAFVLAIIAVANSSSSSSDSSHQGGDTYLSLPANEKITQGDTVRPSLTEDGLRWVKHHGRRTAVSAWGPSTSTIGLDGGRMIVGADAAGLHSAVVNAVKGAFITMPTTQALWVGKFAAGEAVALVELPTTSLTFIAFGHSFATAGDLAAIVYTANATTGVITQAHAVQDLGAMGFVAPALGSLVVTPVGAAGVNKFAVGVEVAAAEAPRVCGVEYSGAGVFAAITVAATAMPADTMLVDAYNVGTDQVLLVGRATASFELNTFGPVIAGGGATIASASATDTIITNGMMTSCKLGASYLCYSAATGSHYMQMYDVGANGATITASGSPVASPEPTSDGDLDVQLVSMGNGQAALIRTNDMLATTGTFQDAPTMIIDSSLDPVPLPSVMSLAAPAAILIGAVAISPLRVAVIYTQDGLLPTTYGDVVDVSAPFPQTIATAISNADAGSSVSYPTRNEWSRMPDFPHPVEFVPPVYDPEIGIGGMWLSPTQSLQFASAGFGNTLV